MLGVIVHSFQMFFHRTISISHRVLAGSSQGPGPNKYLSGHCGIVFSWSLAKALIVIISESSVRGPFVFHAREVPFWNG